MLHFVQRRPTFGAAVIRLLRGEPLKSVVRGLNVTVAHPSEWRDRALAAAEAAMKERERDARDEEVLRLKAKLSEATMANELLMQKLVPRHRELTIVRP